MEQKSGMPIPFHITKLDCMKMPGQIKNLPLKQ